MTEPDEIVRAILDNSPDEIILISPDHKIITFNKRFEERVFTFSGKKLQAGEDSRDYVVFKNKELYQCNFLKAIQGESITIQAETVIDHSRAWYEYRMNAVHDKSEKLIGIILTARNIDRVKKAEIELEKIAETLNAVFENISESFFLVDKNYTVLNFNKIAYNRQKTLGNKELFIGADIRNYFYNKKEDFYNESFIKAVNGESTVLDAEVTTFEGKHIWFQTSMQPIYKKDKSLLGVAIFAKHITEQKLAEIALQQSEEKFRKIVNSTPTPIVIADNESKIVLANTATEKVFQYQPQELLGKNIRYLIPKQAPEKDHQHDLNPPFNKPYESPTDRHITSKTKSGEQILIETSLSTFYLEDKKHIIAIIQDVTQRISYEEQIAQQLERLQKIAWQQSHEIRRPLTNILGAFNLLQSEPEPTAEEQQKYLKYLFESVKELDQIIHNIVDHTS